ncbi:hypothetical protein [Brevundimonas goettingensis]|jgi:hypothetical protein|uniref:FHA domain-containing protein n=1 Tax=Brevundimonas goettingensis TaxID=2774190 RepID=A0A975C1X9_9CAUL|nr:hypothetical protein [Brevundimonas goettingensis]QTC90067.1 hypothetical protein IFJ75_12300 [Brevundimonas goettingensis]
MRASIVLAVSAATLALGACGTTSAPTGPAIVGTPASADDCAVMSTTLEVFSRPLDGTGLKVLDVAVPESPPFMPQRPEQRGPTPISLRGCSFIEVQLVSRGPAVVLGRPEIHDDRVIVSYQEPGASPVHAVLQRKPDGHWQHIGALLTRPQ